MKAKVEHPFLKVKWQFGYAKVRYRGLSTNLERLAMLLGWPICWRREVAGGLTQGTVGQRSGKGPKQGSQRESQPPPILEEGPDFSGFTLQGPLQADQRSRRLV